MEKDSATNPTVGLLAASGKYPAAGATSEFWQALEKDSATGAKMGAERVAGRTLPSLGPVEFSGSTHGLQSSMLCSLLRHSWQAWTMPHSFRLQTDLRLKRKQMVFLPILVWTSRLSATAGGLLEALLSWPPPLPPFLPPPLPPPFRMSPRLTISRRGGRLISVVGAPCSIMCAWSRVLKTGVCPRTRPRGAPDFLVRV